MDFSKLKNSDGQIENPYAANKLHDDGSVTWIEGFISESFLRENYGECNTANEMKNITNSEGLKLFFEWLADKGKIPK